MAQFGGLNSGADAMAAAETKLAFMENDPGERKGEPVGRSLDRTGSNPSRAALSTFGPRRLSGYEEVRGGS